MEATVTDPTPTDRDPELRRAFALEEREQTGLINALVPRHDQPAYRTRCRFRAWRRSMARGVVGDWGCPMRGCIRRRYANSYSIVVDLGYQPDPKTGQLKRKRKWITFHGNLKAAQKELTNQLGAIDTDTFVEPTKTTLLVWLRDWLTLSVKPTARPATYVRYQGIVENTSRRRRSAGWSCRS
jgi:hypothetical protein